MESIRNNKEIIIITLLYAVCVLTTFYWVELPQDIPADRYGLVDYALKSIGALGIPILFFFLTLTIRTMVVDRPKRLIKTLWHNIIHIWIQPAFLSKGLVPLITLQIFIIFFSPMKTLIPVINPYGFWDPIFYEWDNILHFGIDPWVITHTIFSLPIFNFIINFLYSFWFFSIYAIFVLIAFYNSNKIVQKSFFICFFLTWIINGTIFAIIFSSVGPCYYNIFYALSEGPYKPLMDRLYEIDQNHYPLWAIDVQEMLWIFYQNQSFFVGGGISAMPSLHVSTALLQAMAVSKINKNWGRWLYGFFFMILIGSVHLGWHYAVDGYFSIITTLIIWYGVSWVVRKTVKTT